MKKNWGIILIIILGVHALHGQCHIDSVKYELTACEGGEFYAYLNFHYDSTSLMGFKVAGNGIEYGEFSYQDLPVKIGPLKGNGETPYEFVIIDKGEANCSASLEVGTVQCGDINCHISNLEIAPSDCHSEEYYSAKIDFEGVGFDWFDVFANDQFIGFYKVADLPILLDSIPFCGDEFDRLVVCANDNEDCCKVLEYKSPDCFNSCGLSELFVKAVECTDSSFYTKLDVNHHRAPADSFLVKANDDTLRYFLYEELPIVLGPYARSTDQVFEFSIIDFNNQECIVSATLGDDICPCFLNNFTLDVAEDCNSDTSIVAELNFSTEQFDSFNLYINGSFFATYDNGELPLRIANFPNYEEGYAKIRIEAVDGFCVFYEKIELPRCFDKDCFSDLEIERTECDGDVYYALLNFNHEVGESKYFRVKGNGQLYGKFEYASLPVKIGPLVGNSGSDYEILIQDYENEECVIESKVENIDCGGCLLDEMKLDAGACTSDTTYEVLLDFKSELDTFLVYGNDKLVGRYQSNQLPLTITHFPASGKEVDVITICVGDDADCCVKREIHAPGCDDEGCFVDLRKEITDCDSAGLFYIILDFDHVGAHSESFIVKGNGHELEFRYRDLPVKVGPFEGGETFYKFEVCDSEIHSCHIDLPIGRIICEEQCKFGNINTEIIECLDDGSYLLKINPIETEFHGLDLYLNGVPLGFHRKDEFPIELEIPSHSDTLDELKICVSDNETCCTSINLVAPVCDPACEIANFNIDTMDCANDSFYVHLNFDQVEASGHFTLKGNGKEYGAFPYELLPLRLGPFPADGDTEYEFVVIDSLNPNCTSFFELGKISCPSSSESSSADRILILQASDGLVHMRVPGFIQEKTFLKIFDLRGYQITSKLISSQSDPIIIEVPGLYHGMYVLHLESKAGETHNNKFIIH